VPSFIPYRAVFLSVFLAAATEAHADTGQPVAVRWWGQAMVSIESYWNLDVVIDPYGERVGYPEPQVTGDLVLITHEHFDHNNAGAIGGKPVVVHGLDANGKVTPLHRILDRMPNEERPTWTDADSDHSSHAVTVTTISSWHDDEQGRERGANAMFVIDIDGVRIVHCGDLGQSTLTDQQLAALGHVDVLLVPVGGIYTVDGKQAAAIVRQVRPRMAVPIHYKTPALAFDLQPVEPFVSAMESDSEIVHATGNTLAVAATDEKPTKTKVVVLNYQPWVPNGELDKMFVRKVAASHEAQAVFAPLSAKQMNFQPSNGTHTPRWNAEHMMGRELLFFTQIYASTLPRCRRTTSRLTLIGPGPKRRGRSNEQARWYDGSLIC